MPTETFSVLLNADDGECAVGGGSFNTTNDYFNLGNAPGLGSMHSFGRIDNVTIPDNANIDTAILKLTARSTGSATTVNVKIHFEQADDPAAPSDDTDLLNRSLDAGINWNSIGSWTAGVTYDSPELKTGLQNIIDGAGWNSGQAVQIHIVDNSSTASARRLAATLDHTSYTEPQLYVEYSIPYNIDVSETINITESLTIEKALAVLEQVDITEYVNVLLGFDESLPEISENIDITEYVNIIRSYHEASSNVENINISEDINVHVGFGGSLPEISETINITENITVALGFEISVFETITVTETGNIRPEPEAHETITLIENLTVRRGYDVDIDSGFTLSDNWQLFNYTAWLRQNLARSNERFFFTLTGAPNGLADAEIPVSSIFARKRSGSPTYLQVVVPSFNYAEEITDRPAGEMIVEIGYEIDGEIGLREQILIADLEDIRPDEGPVNRSVTLSGHKTISYGANLVTFRRDQATYASRQTRARVFRFAHIDPFVNPGDTVIVGDEQFTCDNIVYTINELQSTMEIREGS